MSSTYLSNLGISKNRKAILAVIDDLYKGEAKRHFLKRWIPESNYEKIDWDKRYVSYNYFKHVIDKTLDFIIPMREITTLKGKFTARKKEILKQFFFKNDWNRLIAKIAKYRKLYGDVFIYWYFEEDNDDNIPKLKVLNPKKMDILFDEWGEVRAYIYNDKIRYMEESQIDIAIENPQSNSSSTQTLDLSIVFEKGKVTTYHDYKIESVVPNRKEFANEFQIIHMIHDYSDNYDGYSTIPAVDLIDVCLSLDNVDTNIHYINNMTGSPQIIAVNADFDSDNSAIGANCIMYFDTPKENTAIGSIKTEVKTLDISGDLQAHYREKTELMDLAYEKAKLIPPSVLADVMKSDSSKVIATVKQALENEIVDFYAEAILKMSFLIDIAFGTYPNKTAEFTMPETNIIESKIDQYILKSYKMQNGELSMSDNLVNLGYSDREVAEKINNWTKETVMMANAKKGVSPQETDLKLTEQKTKISNSKIEAVDKAKDVAMKQEGVTSTSQKTKAKEADTDKISKDTKIKEPKEIKPKIDNNAK